MARFLARRLASSAVVLLGVTLVTFLLARVVPSDPAVTYVGPKATPAELDRVRDELGLDDALPVQFVRYLGGLLRGDWGTSIASKRPVLGEMGERLPATLELVGAALLLAVGVGVLLGVTAAVRRGRLVDGVIRLLAIGGVSVPAFWLGLLLQVLLFRRLGWFPATDRLDPTRELLDPIRHLTGLYTIDALLTGDLDGFREAVRHLVLPAVTLASYPAGVVARMVRATMIEALEADHVRAARAYGVPERVLAWRVALRSALPPALTVLGLTAAYLLTGTFFVEVVFNWPGLGQFAATALLNVDYPAVLGVTLLGALGYVLVNLVVDLMQARLDPRVALS